MKVVTLVGSSKQRKDFEKQVERLFLEGFCPICIGIYLGSENPEDYNEENELKEKLRLAHRKRIELADMIGIIRKPDGGIGNDTLKRNKWRRRMTKKELQKHLWNLWSLSNGEIGEKPPEEEMKKWK